MTKSELLHAAVRTGAAVALAAGMSLAIGCASIPQKAWQNGAAMSSNEVIYGSRSVRGRSAYRSYLEMNTRGLRVSPPSPFAPMPSRIYP
jgi:hypothetical protein